MSKKTIIWKVFCFSLSTTQAFSQSTNSLIIDSAFAMSKRNYPLVRQMALLTKIKEYSVSNASKASLK